MAVQNGNFGQRFAYYVNQLNRTVAANWYVQEVDAHASNGHHVTIVFDVLRDGTVTNVRFESHSGSPSLDSSAQHALQRVQSFTPLPDGYIGDRITVEYQFDYQQQ
jgi:protein TonB